MIADELQVTVLTYLVTTIAISFIAMMLFYLLPKPAKEHELISLRYFACYFAVSCAGYSFYLVSAAEFLPKVLLTFINNALAVLAPYMIFMGLKWKYRADRHIYHYPLIVLHVISVGSVLAFVALMMESSEILVELLFFPNFMTAFYFAFRALLRSNPEPYQESKTLFKITFIFVFIFTPILFAILAYTGEFGYYISGILIMQSVFTLLFLASIYFSYLNKLIAEYKTWSITDPLTGLYNRRYFLQQADFVLRTSKRDQTSGSIIFCDVDNFKQINDNYGHAQGDAVLKSCAGLLQAFLRSGDTVARMGGEEFVILMPNSTLEQAMLTAERIREAVAVAYKQDAAQSADLPSYTVSFGVCELTGSMSIDHYLKIADQALYRAKNNGRNRVECAAGEETYSI